MNLVWTAKARPANLFTSLRKYMWVGLTAIRSNMAHMGELASRVIFMGVILFIFLQLWRVTYSEIRSHSSVG